MGGKAHRESVRETRDRAHKMKLLFLCKRRPMGRDLVDRPYGRFYYLARNLAERGHDVAMALLSYRREAPTDSVEGRLRVCSSSLARTGGNSYLRLVTALIEEIVPDWIVGCSDIYYGILAEHYGRRYGTRTLIDAYDNYEGYTPWCKPLHLLWRRALRNATAISAAGPALLSLMGKGGAPGRELVLPMAADPVGFQLLDRQQCRAELRLPPNATLVGYCGSISSNRGVKVLFKAIEYLEEKQPDTRLVLSGRLQKRLSLPPSAIWLGYVPDAKVPVLINAMDAVAVVNKPSAFGAHSYPVKLYEALKCGVPAVTTRTSATEWILNAHSDLLAEPGDPRHLAEKLQQATKLSRIDYGPQPSWEAAAAALETFLQTH